MGYYVHVILVLIPCFQNFRYFFFVKFVVTTTTCTNMRNSPKIAIQASLGELDGSQAEKVLRYIKALLRKQGKNRDHTAFKKEAMQEIQIALRDKGLKLST